MANRCYKFLSVLLFFLTITGAGQNPDSAPPSEEEVDPSAEQLSAIRKEMEALRRESDRLKAEENTILKLLTQFDVEYQMKTHEIELMVLKQQKTQQQIDSFEQKYKQQQIGLSQQKSYLSRRLVEAYKLGELNYLKLMLRMSKSGDFLRSYQYIAYLARDDSKKVRAYRDSLIETEETRLLLEQENRNLALLKQDLESAHGALLQSRREKMKLLSVVQDQKEMHIDALKELSRASTQLQNFFNEIVPAVPVAPGALLTKFKGRLDWPVNGQVIREYGTYRHPKFGTTTMSNGIEIAAPEGTEVSAVFDGEVVFSEW